MQLRKIQGGTHAVQLWPTKRIVLPLVRVPRAASGQEMNYGRSLARHLKRFDLPLAFVEWATLAQDRAAWR